MSVELLTKILFRRLNHFGYGEEKLRSNDSGNKPHRNKNRTTNTSTKPFCVGRTRRIKGSQARAGIKNAKNNHNQPDNHGDIAEDFKEATGTVKCLEEFTHSFFICKVRDFLGMGIAKQWCFTA